MCICRSAAIGARRCKRTLICGWCLFYAGAWTFLLWGLWHGLGLTLERLGLAGLLARWPSLPGRSWTLLWVVPGWVWFRVSDVEQGWQYWQALLGWHQPGLLAYPWQMALHREQLLAISRFERRLVRYVRWAIARNR